MKPSELLKRLQNPSKEDNRELNNNAELDNEVLKQRLRFQGSIENSRKRASDDSDDSSPQSKVKPTLLQEKNKMLAALLAAPPSNPSNKLKEMPAVRSMPDIPNLVRSMGSPPLATASVIPKPEEMMKVLNTNNNKQTNQKIRQNAMSRNVPKMNDNNNFNLLENQQRMSASPSMTGNMALSAMLNQAPSTQSFEQFVTSSPDISAPVSSSTTAQGEFDPELNDLLENFIENDYGVYNDADLENNFQQLSESAQQLKQQQERAEIHKIEQSLRECEKEENSYSTGSPPAYPLHTAMIQQNHVQPFNQPPPGYSQPRNTTSSQQQQQQQRLQLAGSNIVSNSSSPTVAQATNSQTVVTKPTSQQQIMIQRHLLAQQQQMRLQQQQQKERLLQQQQNQQFLITNKDSCKYLNKRNTQLTL
jgi:hypothetical protein